MTDALPNVGRQVGLLARLWRTELDNRLRPHGRHKRAGCCCCISPTVTEVSHS